MSDNGRPLLPKVQGTGPAKRGLLHSPDSEYRPCKNPTKDSDKRPPLVACGENMLACSCGWAGQQQLLKQFIAIMALHIRSREPQKRTQVKLLAGISRVNPSMVATQNTYHVLLENDFADALVWSLTLVRASTKTNSTVRTLSPSKTWGQHKVRGPRSLRQNSGYQNEASEQRPCVYRCSTIASQVVHTTFWDACKVPS